MRLERTWASGGGGSVGRSGRSYRRIQGLLSKWERRRILVDWNSSYGSQETKLLAESLLLLKQLVMKLVLMVMMMWVLALLKGMEEIGVAILKEMKMVAVVRLSGSPRIRERKLETAIWFGHWRDGVPGVQGSLPKPQIHLFFCSPPPWRWLAVWWADLQRQVWLCWEQLHLPPISTLFSFLSLFFPLFLMVLGAVIPRRVSLSKYQRNLFWVWRMVWVLNFEVRFLGFFEIFGGFDELRRE